MMSIWHLLWVVPLSVISGFIIATILCAAKEADKFIDANGIVYLKPIESKEDEVK